jgi:uncharacterized protein (DUF2141 family)
VKALALALLLAVLAVGARGADALNTLTVQVENVGVHGGTLEVGVYDEAGYSAGAVNPVMTKTLKAAPGTMTVTFVGLAAGNYAVKAVQHTGTGGKAGRHFLGHIADPAGYSNANARQAMPGFDRAKFTVSAGDNRIVVCLFE